MYEYQPIEEQYRNGGALSSWAEMSQKVTGEEWVDRNYELFKEAELIPKNLELGGFSMLISASNVPIHAAHFAKNLDRDFASIAGTEGKRPTIVALDIASDALSKPVQVEEHLENTQILRVNADTNHLPFKHASFDLITDFAGATWYALGENEGVINLLKKYHDALKEGGSLIVDNTYQGAEKDSHLFTGGMLLTSGLVDNTNRIVLDHDRKLLVSMLQGQKLTDSFLVLTKKTGDHE